MILSLLLAQVAEQAPVVAKASPAIVNNFQIALLAFKSGGWIVALIGAAAMVGRLLVDEAADASWQRSLRHVIAAAIFAVIAYFVTFQWELSALNKAIVQGLCGAVAPEHDDHPQETRFQGQAEDACLEEPFLTQEETQASTSYDRQEGRPGQGRAQEGCEETRR